MNKIDWKDTANLEPLNFKCATCGGVRASTTGYCGVGDTPNSVAYIYICAACGRPSYFNPKVGGDPKKLAEAEERKIPVPNLTGAVAPKPVKKPIVNISHSNGMGLIVPYPSGISVVSDCGLGGSLVRSVEGVYVPLGVSWKQGKAAEFLAEVKDYFYQRRSRPFGLELVDVSFLDEFFDRHPRICEFQMEVDEDRLKESEEGWIYVTFEAPPSLCSIPDEFGIFVWDVSNQS